MPFDDARRWLAERLEYAGWRLRGRPVPAPHLHKLGLLRREAAQKPFQAFVETGTYEGATVAGLRGRVPNIYSVEVEPSLYERARERFAGDPSVEILLGDSAVVLPGLMARGGVLDGPVLFWLDGHFSGGVTGKGAKETPIVQELQCLLKRTMGDVILVDDARCFGALPDYPTLDAFKAMVHGLRPDLAWQLKDDIIKLS